MFTTQPVRDFSLDVQSIKRMEHTARTDPQAGLEASAKQFEAIFLQKMLETMRSAMPESGLTDSHRMDMAESLMDRQWAQTMSERGVGLADTLTRQLSAPGDRASAAQAEAPPRIAGLEQATPQPLGASAPPRVAASVTTETGPLIDMTGGGSLFGDSGGQGLKGAPLIEMDPRGAMTSVAVDEHSPEHVAAFVERMGEAARVAGERTGIPQKLILAQAALETGWGRFEVKRADGSPSYNVFNIKATGWDGDVAVTATHEYRDGVKRAEQAAFRAYDDYTGAFSDYARLLSESPRYAEVARSQDAPAAARMLQQAGYATDPAYAEKLISIMDNLPEIQRSGVAPLVDMQGGQPLFGARG